MCLAAIKDLATREILGWSMADHLRAELCLDALVMALQRHGITQPMSRRGNCLDNAPMESLFAALKVEHVHQVRFRTRAEARAAAFECLEIFYNRQRLHSGLGCRTPAEARASMEGVTMRAAA